jgi:hypothetical protein
MMDEGNIMDEGNMMDEDGHDGSTSSSEDEIVLMCRRNLMEAQNVIAQMVPILVCILIATSGNFPTEPRVIVRLCGL